LLLRQRLAGSPCGRVIRRAGQRGAQGFDFAQRSISGGPKPESFSILNAMRNSAGVSS